MRSRKHSTRCRYGPQKVLLNLATMSYVTNETKKYTGTALLIRCRRQRQIFADLDRFLGRHAVLSDSVGRHKHFSVSRYNRPRLRVTKRKFLFIFPFVLYMCVAGPLKASEFFRQTLKKTRACNTLYLLKRATTYERCQLNGNKKEEAIE